ncbi:MAG: glycoside hydrolase family 127 protein [Acidobacteria bacterium]|nr:glycoside hydrolase family 127 protein [Acidobacteriota bacterium]MBV9624809.1 glycoside hydrolase family 127 protein [Acidobacteriota bacterium]
MTPRISRREFLSAVAISSTASVLPRGAYSAAIEDAGAIPDISSHAPSLSWQDQGVLNLANSPYAKLHSVPVRAVTIEEGFWSKRRKTNVERSIPSMRLQLEQHGRMENFRRLVGKSSAEQQGPVFSDSDIYKWSESVGWALQSESFPELRGFADSMIREVVAVQEPSGYLNTYYQGERARERMLQHSQEVGHELYCLGHMLQAGVAYYRATGDSTLLDAGMRFVDKFVLPNYGPGPNQTPIISGHPEIEMALIELHRTTGKHQYVELAGYILEGDSRWKIDPKRIIYMFCGIPFTTRTKLEGHAVRAMYACCGAADYYLETGDAAYWKSLNVLWDDLIRRQMYITGGVGARSQWEAFGDSYELPNAQAYGESCAAIGNMMWNWRMLAASGEAKFTDVIERALYNGINSGMSLNGTTYCYRNPLAFDPASGDTIRNPWYDVTCCPPNLERTFASLPGYFYSTSKDGLYVHLYDNSRLEWHLEDGTPLSLRQQTKYPWDGDVALTLTPKKPSAFTLHVRIPGWARNAAIKVNGNPQTGVEAGEYFGIRRDWKPGDTVLLNFPMETEIIASNPRVVEDRGRVAVRRGPIIYCMEELDQSPGVALADASLTMSERLGKEFESEYKSDFLDGVVVLHHRGGVFETSSAEEALYSPATLTAPKLRPEDFTMIPYYVWANRQPSAMQVWTPYVRA